jgi:hypothetical protein
MRCGQSEVIGGKICGGKFVLSEDRKTRIAENQKREG